MSRELAGWLMERLVCPRDHLPVVDAMDGLRCTAGHSFHINGEIPVFLRDDEESTHPELEPTGEKRSISERWRVNEAGGGVDEFVQAKVGATCGTMYEPLIDNLGRYPIPELRVVPLEGRGKTFLDIGCNWGRWSIAASRLGYQVVGIDPMLDAVRAAWRVARQLKSNAQFMAAEARWLPFADASFDVVFSYSVFQHLRKEDVRSALDEISRVLVPEGLAVVEMPTAAGLRNLYVRARRMISAEELAPSDFHVRYWPLDELVETFTQHVGPTRVEVDSFFFINGQPVDRDLLPARYRAAITGSELLRKASKAIPQLKRVADSVYLASRKAAN